MNEILILGAAIGDVLVYPARAEMLNCPSSAARVRVSTGGDALNESTVLARLGHAPALGTVLGADDMAKLIEAHCAREGVRLIAQVNPEIDTGVNVVLVEEGGERRFITNPQGSLRRFSLEDARAILNDDAFSECRMLCLASMFVSPELPLADMEALFAHARAAGKIVCADATRCKNGETLADAAGALSQLDYFFPNAEEARLLTGAQDDREAARLLNGAGAKNAVIKRGGAGCLIANAEGQIAVPAYRTNCVDTTGAGDTFSAAFQAALLEGRGIAECGAFACAAASICVENLSATGEKLDRNEIERRARAILNQM
ncbi:MAG: PfkB family carbohydrate kinase [Candidatus Faecivicinus sp.]|nr:PfkB family carbohydrate kinase [Candidatus Faecivicinus sp.]